MTEIDEYFWRSEFADGFEQGFLFGNYDMAELLKKVLRQKQPLTEPIIDIIWNIINTEIGNPTKQGQDEYDKIESNFDLNKLKAKRKQ